MMVIGIVFAFLFACVFAINDPNDDEYKVLDRDSTKILIDLVGPMEALTTKLEISVSFVLLF